MKPTDTTHPYFRLMYRRIIEGRKYVAAALVERELWKQDAYKYEKEYWTREKEMSNDCIQVNLQSVQHAIIGELFSNVEHITWNDESKLATWMDLPRDEPFSPFIDDIIAEIGTPDWLEE